MPLKLTDLTPGRHELKATFHFSTGETQQDTFSIDVLQPPPSPPSAAKTALFDPQGETARLLTTLGVHYQKVEDPTTDLSIYDTLIVGKHALTLTNPASDIARVRQGLKVILFEQTGEVLEQRLGFRIAEYGLREVFERVPNHPCAARPHRGQPARLARLSYQLAAASHL